MATTTANIQNIRLRANRGRTSRPRPKVSISLAYLQDHLERGIITRRDQQLLFLLADCLVLSYDQIKRLYWPASSHTACRRRLRKLYDLHYLDRTLDVSARMGELGLEPGLVYTLGKAGRLWLEKLHNQPKTPDYPLANAVLILHDLGLAEVMVLMTLAAREKGLTTTWQGEAAARMIEGDEKTAKVLLEPDALMTLEYAHNGSEPTTLAFFVEWDTGSERGHEIPRKIRRYDLAHGREKTWQDKGLSRFPGVLLVAPSALRADHLAAKVLATRQTGVVWLVGDAPAPQQNPLGGIWRVIGPNASRVLENKSLLPGLAL